MSSKNDPEEEAVDAAAEPTTARPKPAPEESKPKLDYEFKITRADPKNNFDFEDVADK